MHMFVKQYAPDTSSKCFSIKVKVKVTMSLTSVSFERESLVEYAFQIWSLYFRRLKVIANAEVDKRKTYKQTDRTKQYVPIIRSGGIII